MRRSGWAAVSSCATVLLLAVGLSGAAQAARWTFTPELKRLDAGYTELPAGLAHVARDQSLRVGLYVRASSDEVSDMVMGSIGFESLLGAIHFESEDFAGADISAIVTGLSSGVGWERRMMATFSTGQDELLGPPGRGIEGRSWIFFWDDATNGEDAMRGAWCTPVNGSCRILLGVLTVPLTGVVGEQAGDLTIGVGGLFSPQEPVRARSMFAQAEVGVMAGNSVSYSICAQAGCPATVGFEAEAYALGEGGTLEIAATLDQALDSEVEVPIRVADTSTAAEDLYSLSQTFFTFAAGESSASLTVTAVGNAVDEEDEVATLVLEFGELPEGLREGAIASTSISIRDNDDPVVELSYGAADYTAREGGAAAEVSLNLSASPEREIRIPITTELELGASEGDFEGVPDSITFTADEVVQTFEVRAVDESDRDLGESLRLGFGELPPGVTLGSQSTTRVALRDNDTNEITLSLSESSVIEESATVELRVTASLVLSASDVLAAPVILPLVLGGTAVSGEDYSLPGQVPSIVIPANSGTGDSADVTLSITLVDDEIVEFGETLSIDASAAGFDVYGAKLEITDSDRASLSVRGPEAPVEEGGEVSFEVRLSHPVVVDVSVDWSLVDASALVADDLESATTSGTLTFAAGSEAGATQNLVAQVRDDALSEAEESFVLSLSSVTADGFEDGRVGIDQDATSAEASIAASDPLELSLSGPPSVVEGSTVTLLVGVDGGVPETDLVATLGVSEQSTADANDYSGLPESVTIPAGESSASFTLAFARDTVREGEESLILSLTAAQGRGAGGVSVDGEAGSLRIGIQEYSLVVISGGAVGAAEGGTVSVPLLVDPPLKDLDISVGYLLEAESAGADDYSDATGGRVHLAAGEAHAEIRVRTLDDRLSERAETFVVRLTGIEAEGSTAPPVVLGTDERQTSVRATIEPSDPLSISIDGPRELREGSHAIYRLSIGGGESTEDVSLTPLIAPGSEADLNDVSGLGAKLTIPAGQASASFTLSAHKDEMDEGEERLIVEFSDLEGGGGGGLAMSADAPAPQVLITEAHLQARAEAMQFALAGIGRTLGDNLVEMLGEQAGASARIGERNHLTLGGRTLGLDELIGGGGDGLGGWLDAALGVLGVNLDSPDGLASEMARATGVANGEVGLDMLPDLATLLSDSAFRYGFGGENGKPSTWTLWGSGDLTRFEGRPADHFRMRGEVMGGHLGLDYRASENLLAGLAVSRTRSEVAYGSHGEVATDGRFTLQLTSAHPHVHWSPSDGLGLWGSVGYGIGDALLGDEKGEAETSVSMQMAAVGARRGLRPLGGLEFSFKADAYLVRMRAEEQVGLLGVEADASRLRLALAASRDMAFRGGSLVTGSLEFGARTDGGHAGEGAGAELRAGVAFAHPAGFNLNADGHMLLAHEADGYRQWGASLNMGFDAGIPGQGIQFQFAPNWGTPAMGAEGIWTAGRATEALGAGGFDQGMGLETRFAYGLELARNRGLLTLFTELDQSGGMVPSLRFGGELGGWQTRHSHIEFELYAERTGPRLGRDPEHGLVLKIRGGF